MEKPCHKALKYEYAFIPAKLTCNVDVIGISSPNPGKKITVRALWDTGAERSVITPKVSHALGLIHIDNVIIYGVNQTSPAEIVRATVVLP